MSRQQTKSVFIELVKKYLDDKASKKEIHFIEQYYDHFGKEEDVTNTLSAVEIKKLEDEIKGNINTRILKMERKKGAVISRSSFLGWAAAAAILIFIPASIYLLYNHTVQKYPVALNDQAGRFKNDVAPGGDKAILILGDGSKVVLDNTRNGSIGQQGNSKVLKIDAGKLAYNAQSTIKNGEPKILFNTISTPRGGQYQVELSDGTKVWLNASSSLYFPTSFVAGKERVVELKGGEAYFEVAKNKTMPFKVKVNKMDIQVLGTHFNVMAYNDEHAIKTTLLEGSVKINTHLDNKAVYLQPGQQAQLDNHGDVNVSQNVDIDLAVAWKNGFTAFKSADIATIMRQVGRWYDVDVVYEGVIPERTFTGKISRNANLSDLLRLLEVSKIHFKIDGRKIIVFP
jgi:hypothetical protein